jgi:hypothetical protein
MFVHPYINLEISRQRQQAILGERERDRTAKVVLADRPARTTKSFRPPSLMTAHRSLRASA